MELFKGKALIKRSGKYLIICGVFIPSEDINTYCSNNEMWAVEFAALQTIKYERKESSETFSPEEFLENIGNIQSKNNWDKKNNATN